MARSDTLTLPRPARRPITPGGDAVVPLLPSGRSDAWRLSRAFLIIFFLTTVDVTNFLDRGNVLKYVVLMGAPLVVFGMMRLSSRSTSIRRLQLSDRFLLALFLIGLAGSIYGKLFNKVADDGFPIFLPLLLALLPLAVGDDLTDEDARRLLKALALIFLGYMLINAVANSGFAGLKTSSGKTQYRNAQLLYVAMGFAGAFILRKNLRRVVVVVLWAYIFKTYPSGTAAFVIVVTMGTLFITRRNARNTSLYFALGAVVLVVGIAIANFGSAVSLSDQYFALVHKKNNDNARVALWQGGIRNFEKSPLVGQVFTGDNTILVIRRDGLGQPFKAPFHSDYVLMLSQGGLLGLGLFVGWAISTELTMYRRYRGFLRAGQADKANLLRLLLIGFNAFFASAAFNPELTGASRTASIAAVYGMMLLLGRPQRTEPAPAGAHEPRGPSMFIPARI
jgi:hypothetical protein